MIIEKYKEISTIYKDSDRFIWSKVIKAAGPGVLQPLLGLKGDEWCRASESISHRRNADAIAISCWPSVWGQYYTRSYLDNRLVFISYHGRVDSIGDE